MRHTTRVNESQRSRLWHYCGADLPSSCSSAAAGALWMYVEVEPEGEERDRDRRPVRQLQSESGSAR